MTIDRLHPEVTVRNSSPNKSARTTGISLIVLHSTESDNIPDSSSDLAGVASWFSNPSAQVSAHVITDADGHSARCVSDGDKAWHCAAYNSPALGIEQIGRASQTHWDRDEWLETCRWIAQWSHEHDIPIRRAITMGGRVIRSGVTTHKKLGSLGGSHTDPGSSYPMGKVLKQARHIKRLRYGK
jgi:N-acetyl-anhydromuramyl-L-alanine amidase AmpD